ncbi:MAG: putative membrane protein, partial [uncultured Solirubrobacteraceae bacterium]
ERRPRRAARRRRRARPRGRGVRRRRRRRREPREREGRRRDRRRRRRHAALCPGVRGQPRAPDDQADRGRLAAQQAPLHPPRGAAAQPVPAVAAHADPDDRRRLPLLRGRGEAVGGDPPARRARGGAGCAARREPGGDARPPGDPHGLHPLGGDHGDLAQRGRRRAVPLAHVHPHRRRVRHHGARLRGGRVHREDGRHRAEAGADEDRGRRVVRARPGAGHADRDAGAVDGRDRGDAVGRRTHPPRGPRRARPPPPLRPGPRRRGGRARRARRGRRRRFVADQHRRVGGPGAPRRRDHRRDPAPAAREARARL